MKKQLMVLALALFAAVGCTSTNVSSTSAPVASGISAPLTATVTVGEEVTGESTTTLILGLIKLGDTKFADGVNYGIGGGAPGLLDQVIPGAVGPTKAAAAYKALTSSGADVLVAPKYEVVVNDFFVFGTVKAKVTAKKGTLSNIKSVN